MGIYKSTLNTEIEEKLNKEHIVGLFEIKEIGSILQFLKTGLLFLKFKNYKRDQYGHYTKKVTNLQTGHMYLPPKNTKLGCF